MELRSQIKFKVGKPSCDVLQRKYDNPISYSHGFYMPRIGWHILYPTISLGSVLALERLKVPKKVAVPLVFIGEALVPHILGGIVFKKYPIDVIDWSFDAWDRSLPAWAGSKKDLLIYTSGYLVLECFGHP